METTYTNAIADHGASLITHIGLVNAEGTEVSTERKAASWDAASNGRINLSAALTFDVAGGLTVAGWRGFSQVTGGTNYGGASLTEETFAGDGTYTLNAGGATYIDHTTP